ncbi:class I SAM-dependent methyltransferase [Thermodesulfobacteriota bacterium]
MIQQENISLEKGVISLYSQNFITKMYTILRFKLSPIAKIEKYVPQKGDILDLGCGSGIFANILYLGSKERNILGVDLSSARIEIAKRLSKDNPNMKFMTGDVNSVTFADFGIITLIDLLHHMTFADQEKLLNKVFSKLHAGGLLLIKDLEKYPLWKYVFHYIQDTISYKGAKLYFRRAEAMVALLNRIGFEVEIISLASGYPHPHVLYRCTKK